MNKQMSAAAWLYEDIVNLPHHVSKRHPQMPMIKRAAQFAPFAALTGYEEAVAGAAKLNLQGWDREYGGEERTEGEAYEI